jgi:hypothetical protein
MVFIVFSAIFFQAIFEQQDRSYAFKLVLVEKVNIVSSMHDHHLHGYFPLVPLEFTLAFSSQFFWCGINI